MNPIRALLWKEGREAAYKTVFGAGLALLLGLGHIDLNFSIETVCHLVGVFGAVLMGMDLVAGERSRGTLSFLLSRPLSPGQLLAVKFAVGAAGLLAVLAAYWAGVYLGMPEWGNTNFPWGLFWDPGNFRSPYQKEILTDVGYGRNTAALVFSLHGRVRRGVSGVDPERLASQGSGDRPDGGLGRLLFFGNLSTTPF